MGCGILTGTILPFKVPITVQLIIHPPACAVSSQYLRWCQQDAAAAHLLWKKISHGRGGASLLLDLRQEFARLYLLCCVKITAGDSSAHRVLCVAIKRNEEFERLVQRETHAAPSWETHSSAT